MEKPKIFIASSGRTLILAEKLRDELVTDFCDAKLWSDESRASPGATIIEMLQSAADRYDFAVILLARDDVIVREAGEAMKARDNCVFEAGIFIAALGRERCFLVNSVDQRDLPSDLGGIISVPFKEPANLRDRQECADAISSASAILKDKVQRLGRIAVRGQRSEVRDSVPLLSVAEVIQRERPQRDGGDLQEGQIVVCDLQPMIEPDFLAQVSRNLNSGISYFYFWPLSEDTISKACHCLQFILADKGESPGKIGDFQHRLEVVKHDRERILEDLSRICITRSLRICLLPDENQFRFRIHNAGDPELARVYMKYGGKSFALWMEGTTAVKVWALMPKFLPPEEKDRIFVPMRNFRLQGEQMEVFTRSLNLGLKRYFPGMEDAVRDLCIGRVEQAGGASGMRN